MSVHHVDDILSGPTLQRGTEAGRGHRKLQADASLGPVPVMRNQRGARALRTVKCRCGVSYLVCPASGG
jgi:hypothetical protein